MARYNYEQQRPPPLNPRLDWPPPALPPVEYLEHMRGEIEKFHQSMGVKQAADGTLIAEISVEEEREEEEAMLLRIAAKIAEESEDSDEDTRSEEDGGGDSDEGESPVGVKEEDPPRAEAGVPAEQKEDGVKVATAASTVRSSARETDMTRLKSRAARQMRLLRKAQMLHSSRRNKQDPRTPKTPSHSGTTSFPAPKTGDLKGDSSSDDPRAVEKEMPGGAAAEGDVIVVD